MDAGVHEEFTEFVKQRGGALFRVAYSLCGQQHAAEDLLQNALAKAVVKWRAICNEPENYVRTVLYREFVSGWRWRRIRPELVVPQPPEVADADHADSTVLRLALQRALATLPPRQRAVLVLRYLEDFSERQAAEILGCTPGTIASQTSRALARLRMSGELGNGQPVRFAAEGVLR